MRCRASSKFYCTSTGSEDSSREEGLVTLHFCKGEESIWNQRSKAGKGEVERACPPADPSPTSALKVTTCPSLCLCSQTKNHISPTDSCLNIMVSYWPILQTNSIPPQDRALYRQDFFGQQKSGIAQQSFYF